MKKKQQVDLATGLLLTLYAIITIALPTFEVNNVKIVLIITFAFYALINLVRFMVLIKTKDYEGLHYATTSIVMLIIVLLTKQGSPYKLAIILFCWIALNSLAKLKKADYYHDRRDRMWKFGILDLILFLIAGVLTCINLAYTGDVQIIVIGFFLFVNGILEVFDPIIKSLIAHS